MKDIELIDHTLGRIAQAGDMEIKIEARDLERICVLALQQVKSRAMPDNVGRSEQFKCRNVACNEMVSSDSDTVFCEKHRHSCVH